MATTTTNTFNLDIGDIVDEAVERCGLEARTGYDYKTARRSLDLMMLEWQNRGLNLWTIENGTTTLTAGTSEYTFDADTVDFLEVHLRLDSGDSSNQTDYELRRVSVSEYADLPNKLLEGRPLTELHSDFNECKVILTNPNFYEDGWILAESRRSMIIASGLITAFKWKGKPYTSFFQLFREQGAKVIGLLDNLEWEETKDWLVIDKKSNKLLAQFDYWGDSPTRKDVE